MAWHGSRLGIPMSHSSGPDVHDWRSHALRGILQRAGRGRGGRISPHARRGNSGPRMDRDINHARSALGVTGVRRHLSDWSMVEAALYGSGLALAHYRNWDTEVGGRMPPHIARNPCYKMSSRSLSGDERIASIALIGPSSLSLTCDSAKTCAGSGRASPLLPLEVGRAAQRAFHRFARRRQEVPIDRNVMPLESPF
jgi:hypothetical protein